MTFSYIIFLCRLPSIVAHRDHFVQRLSVHLSSSHTFLVVTHSYVSQATHAFLGMLPLLPFKRDYHWRALLSVDFCSYSAKLQWAWQHFHHLQNLMNSVFITTEYIRSLNRTACSDEINYYSSCYSFTMCIVGASCRLDLPILRPMLSNPGWRVSNILYIVGVSCRRDLPILRPLLSGSWMESDLVTFCIL